MEGTRADLEGAARGVTNVAQRADSAARNAETAAQAATEASRAATDTQSKLDKVLNEVAVADPTRRFVWWEQAPAWGIWLVALGLAFYMVGEGYDSDAGWTFVIVALIVGIILSYRTKFSWDPGQRKSPSGGSPDDEAA